MAPEKQKSDEERNERHFFEILEAHKSMDLYQFKMQYGKRWFRRKDYDWMMSKGF